MPSRKSPPSIRPPAAATPGAREAKRQLTRERVLAVALEEFREHGFADASTARIARDAGVSHGTVFTVEPTKERLAVAAFDGQLRSIGQKAFAQAFASKAGLEGRIWKIFSALFSFYDSHHRIARVLLREMLVSVRPDGTSEDDRLLKDYLAGLRALIESATAARQGKSPDAEALASAILGVYLVFLLAKLNGVYPDEASHQTRCRKALSAIVAPWS